MFGISNLTRQKIEKLPFEKIKDCVLGKNYELSLVLIGERRSKGLNLKYRNKNKSTDILSFSISKECGEIFITPTKANKESKKFNLSEKKFLVFLFIHGLFHLKGMEHGSKMEKAEEKIRRKFKI